MRISGFCICENKGTDQLHDNRATDQRLYYHYIDRTTIPLLPMSCLKFQAASHLLWPYSTVCVRNGQKLRGQIACDEAHIL